jgi:hypothetical protein
MNLTRGFLRLWAVVSLIWIIGFGFNVFLDWRQSRRPAEPALCQNFEEGEANIARCKKNQTQLIADIWSRREWQVALLVSPPLGALIFIYAVAWIARGFRR